MLVEIEDLMVDFWVGCELVTEGTLAPLRPYFDPKLAAETLKLLEVLDLEELTKELDDEESEILMEDKKAMLISQGVGFALISET